MAAGRSSGAAVVLVGLAAVPASGVAGDCRNPMDQSTMNRCAGDDHRAADRALNAQYKLTRGALAAFDGAAEKQLIAAQKAWIGFRDAHCETAAFANKGGSMEPLTRFGCLAELTRARTVQLKELADGF